MLFGKEKSEEENINEILKRIKGIKNNYKKYTAQDFFIQFSGLKKELNKLIKKIDDKINIINSRLLINNNKELLKKEIILYYRTKKLLEKVHSNIGKETELIQKKKNIDEERIKAYINEFNYILKIIELYKDKEINFLKKDIEEIKRINEINKKTINEIIKKYNNIILFKKGEYSKKDIFYLKDNYDAIKNNIENIIPVSEKIKKIKEELKKILEKGKINKENLINIKEFIENIKTVGKLIDKIYEEENILYSLEKKDEKELKEDYNIEKRIKYSY